MGIFDKIKEPVVLKEDSSSLLRLEALRTMQKKASGELRQKLEQEIKMVEAGIYGEEQILFELKNSHLPMVVLHDLFFEADGCAAQIDYLLVTRARVFVLECKNLFGNIEIDADGAFTRRMGYGAWDRSEGIYSPVTQNRRHLELIRKIRKKKTAGFFTKLFFDKNFNDTYRSVVVLANSRTYLNAKNAPEEIKNQVIRGDQLIDYIQKVNAEKNTVWISEKEMLETAEFFLRENKENPVDYLAKYRRAFSEKEPAKIRKTKEPSKICPRCGAQMVKRVAAKGQNAGKEFWGCSRFPNCRQTANIDS